MHAWVGGPPSTQELAVLARLVRGLSNDEIGDELGIREQTVKKHVSSLLHKFSAVNRAELPARAVAWGVVPAPPEPEEDVPT